MSSGGALSSINQSSNQVSFVKITDEIGLRGLLQVQLRHLRLLDPQIRCGETYKTRKIKHLRGNHRGWIPLPKATT